MDIGAILLILAAALLVGVFVSRPFFDRRFETQPLVARQSAARSAHNLSHLLAEKDHLLAQLADLDFDHSMGKASPEDYPAQRAKLLLAGADLLRQIDELAPAGNGAGKPARAAAPGAGGDEIERLIAARRQSAGKKKNAATGFCPKCGRPVGAEDRFCPKCGASL